MILTTENKSFPQSRLTIRTFFYEAGDQWFAPHGTAMDDLYVKVFPNLMTLPTGLLKKGGIKNRAAGQNCGRIFGRFSTERAEKGPNFLKISFSPLTLSNSVQITEILYFPRHADTDNKISIIHQLKCLPKVKFSRGPDFFRQTGRKVLPRVSNT
jgi:hypothetical protein